MNRTLKFRVWSDVLNKFNFFDLRKDNFNPALYKDNAIIHQYTGLSDHYGNDIYESDYIQAGEIFVAEITYLVGNFIFKSIPTKHIKDNFLSVNHGSLSNILLDRTFDIKVIGNNVENSDIVTSPEERFIKIEEE